jgi:hypothetical protein
VTRPLLFILGLALLAISFIAVPGGDTRAIMVFIGIIMVAVAAVGMR